MKLYYCENLLHDGEIEEFYLLETDFGVLELDEGGAASCWKSLEDFKKLWKNFDKYAILVELE